MEMPWKKVFEYRALPSEGDEKPIDRRTVARSRLLLCLSIAFGIALFGLGVFTGRQVVPPVSSPPEWGRKLDRHDIETELKVFHYERIFAKAPSLANGTEAAWDSLVPMGQGFVRNPDSDHRAALSAVHQLHCLYSIRIAYFEAVSEGDRVEDYPHQLDQRHMRHCFDYLRQGIMCAADSTLEPEVAKLGGVTGWGVPRKCGKWGQLVAWAEQHRLHNRTGFREGLGQTADHSEHGH